MVELIVVMAILGVLALMAIPAYSKIKDTAREARAMEEIRGLEKSINAFAIDQGTLPDNLGQIGQASLLDPWGHPYRYANIAKGETPRTVTIVFPENLNEDFDLYSLGADGDTALSVNDPKSLDDIVRAGDGGYVGLGKNLGF